MWVLDLRFGFVVWETCRFAELVVCVFLFVLGTYEPVYEFHCTL